MTKDVKFSITIEVEKGQRTRTEYRIQSNKFGQEMNETIKQLSQIIGKEVLQNYDNQLQKEEARGLKTVGRETRKVEMEFGEVEIKRRVYILKDGNRWMSC